MGMLKFAIVGCGRIARRHADLLGKGQIKDAELVAVCDCNSDKSKAFGLEFGIPYFMDLNTMLTQSDIDVVSILTESGSHADHVIKVADFGKHIVVEKPMALRIRDAESMIEKCAKSNVKLFVVKQNRFNVPVQETRKALEQGRFGKLILGTVRVRWCRTDAYYDQDDWRGTWKMDGGVLTNQASHHIDLLEWMFGAVVSVHAMSTTALANIEVEDTAIATLRFENGALGIVEATTATRPKDLEGSLSILGENGMVEISGFAVNQMKEWHFKNPLPSDKLAMSKYSENPPDVYGYGHKAYYKNVVDCILHDSSPLVDGNEALKSLKLIHALYKSIETNSEVRLNDLSPPIFTKLGQQ